MEQKYVPEHEVSGQACLPPTTQTFMCLYVWSREQATLCLLFRATIQAMTNLGGSVCVFHPKTPFSHLFLNDDLVKLHFSILNEIELILFLFHSKFLYLKRVHQLEITGMFVEILF